MPDDGSAGIPTGVHRTPITTDERGRRVRDDGQHEAFPAVADQAVGRLQQQVAGVVADLGAYKALNDARTVATNGTPAFSGTFGSGLQYSPQNAPGGGAGGPGGGEPVPTNPYVLGTNATNSDHPEEAQNDSWTLAGGPSPAGGGPFDGVTSASGTNTLLTRIWPDVSGTINQQVLASPSGTVTFTIVTYHRFARQAVVNQFGAIVSISAEVTDGTVSFVTVA